MLRRFNLLVEQVINSINKNIRFELLRDTKVLQHLSDQQKDEFNKKCDQMVLKELETALNNGKAIYILFKARGFKQQANATIDKIYEKNGQKCCDLHRGGEALRLTMKNLQEDKERFKKYRNDPDHTFFANQLKISIKRYQQELEHYFFSAVPISYILTNSGIKYMRDLVNQNEEIDQTKYEHIFNHANDDIKFLLKYHLIDEDQLLSLLKWKGNGSISNQEMLSKKYLSDEVLKKFKIDKNGQDYQKAKYYSEHDKYQTLNDRWFNGGTQIYLKVTVNAKPGERFDVNRLSANFSYYLLSDGGDNERQYQEKGFVRD